MNTKIKYFYWFLLISFCFTSCKVGRYVVYNFADIKDYKKFPARNLEKSAEPFQFPSAIANHFPTKEMNELSDELNFEDYLTENATVAFLVIQNDSIQYEKYFSDYEAASIVPSFSMAKSIISILIGCAIDEGLIQSVEDAVTNYIPELTENGYESVSIEHLLTMTSGMDFKEAYKSPFSDAATFYYGRTLRKSLDQLKLKRKPGEKFEYVSGSTQLLGLILERVIGERTVTQYLQEKLWTPLAMEYDASWSIDRKKNGLEKTFCCVNARARDFAKIGRLYLNKGNWNGKQIVSQNWVEKSTKVDSTNGRAWKYQYQWWLPSKEGDYEARGILGQYIYVNPAKNIVIVRLGKSRKDVKWEALFRKIAAAY